MRAHARLVVTAEGGRTRFVEIRSDPPLTLRRTGEDEVAIVGSAASPVGGDELRLDVVVGPGARLVVRSVAASIAHPSPHGEPSTLSIDVDVGAGAVLEWRPQPLVLVDRCQHATTSRLRLAAGAGLVWYDIVRLGRHDEATGSLLQRTRVDRDGLPLLRTELAVGPAWAGWGSPAVLDERTRAAGSGLRVGVAAPTASVVRRAGIVAVAHPLTDDATAWTVLGGRAAGVVDLLDEVLVAGDAQLQRRCSL